MYAFFPLFLWAQNFTLQCIYYLQTLPVYCFFLLIFIFPQLPLEFKLLYMKGIPTVSPIYYAHGYACLRHRCSVLILYVCSFRYSQAKKIFEFEVFYIFPISINLIFYTVMSYSFAALVSLFVFSFFFSFHHHPMGHEHLYVINIPIASTNYQADGDAWRCHGWSVLNYSLSLYGLSYKDTRQKLKVRHLRR